MDGAEAVRKAREYVEDESGFRRSKVEPLADADGNAGVFVTLSTFPGHDLRGCIGIPMPVLPLRLALEQAARSACHDPRFPPLSADEARRVTVEVTLMSVPERVGCPKEELPSRIVIGRDGLIIRLGGRSGLLLPQVPVEWGWDAYEYLAHLSLKAGLPQDAWMSTDAVIESFTGRVFRETEPCGEITEG